MSSELMDAGTYAWIVIIIFFLLFTALQIRNCVRNVRDNVPDLYPTSPYLSGQPASSVYTIDVTRAHTNAGYISTEGANKTSQQTNDGLPTYEEAIAGGKGTVLPTPSTQSVVPSETCIPIEAPTNENIAIDTGERRGRRHHHRRHRHHRESAAENTDSNGAQNPGEHHRRRHKRGLRHLTKINRRNRHSETDQ